MSALLRVKVGVMAAGLSCLALGYATAQQPTQAPAEKKTAPFRDPGAGQIDRQLAPRTDPAAPRGQQRTANFRGPSTAGSGQEVENYLVNCLISKNQAEIKINEFAAKQSQNPEVKQFAEQMVKDHQQLVQKLQQLAGGSAATRPAGDALGTAPNLGNERQPGDSSSLPGAPGADPTLTTAPADTALDRNPGNDLTGTNRATAGSNAALNQLAEIEQKIGERCMQALHEELQQKSGAEFDECYLGAQIAGHMHMLAALEVIPQESQGQLKQVADAARPTVQQHLEHARQLMKQAKASSGTPGTAERGSTSTRLQQ